MDPGHSQRALDNVSKDEKHTDEFHVALSHEGSHTISSTAHPKDAPYSEASHQRADFDIAPSTEATHKPDLPPRTPSPDNPSHPLHYTRDPHQLTAYLVPFPKPHIKDVTPASVPERFLLYTPPPPPLLKPPEGVKESKAHKVQRKWQAEVRAAKTSTAKTASWQGIKSKATRGISWAVDRTTSANLDFINRMGGEVAEGGEGKGDDNGEHAEKGVALTDLVLVYPASLPGDQEAIRAEFVHSMLRTKNKAQRDSVIATGLLPVAFAVDLLATLIWPFGGLAEIDAVWGLASFRGAKIARSTTKRLQSSSSTNGGSDSELRLSFVPAPRLDVLQRYLAVRCHECDRKLFPSVGHAPTETEVLEAIGWAPSQTGGEQRNWEDEQWEVAEVKEDFRLVMQKGSKEWDKWCKAFAKNPEKAMKR